MSSDRTLEGFLHSAKMTTSMARSRVSAEIMARINKTLNCPEQTNDFLLIRLAFLVRLMGVSNV